RAGWGVADQGLSSFLNLAVGALVARAVSPASFGAFGLMFSTYLIVLGACRALVAEPLVVRFSAQEDAEWRSAARAATGAALALGRFVLAWVSAWTCAALVGGLQARLLPAPIAGPSWIRSQRDLAFPYLGEYAALGAGEAALFGVAGLAGLAAAGALRAGQILVGPLRVLFLGVRLTAVPEGVRLLGDSRSNPRAAAVRLSAGLAGVALAWGALLTLVPSSLGESLVGRSWGEAKHVMVPLSLAMAGTGAMTGALIGLRALAAARRSLLSRVLVTPFVVAATIAGAAVAGAPGTAWALAAVTWLSLGLWWRQFLGALAEQRQPAEAARASRAPVTPVGPRA